MIEQNTGDFQNPENGKDDPNILLMKILHKIIDSNYKSSMNFARNPQKVDPKQSIGYEWVPQPDTKDKLPTNVNLLLQRLFLLSAIPLNNNEKRLFEQLIISYQDQTYFNETFRDLFGIKLLKFKKYFLN